MFAYCVSNPVNNYDSSGARCARVKPLVAAPKKATLLDQMQNYAEKISYFLFELGEATADGITGEIAVGMGLGLKGKVVIDGIPIEAEIVEALNIAVTLENGEFDIKIISGISGSLPFSEIVGLEAGSRLEHSIFDPLCTCHINSTLRDFITCPANKHQIDVSPSVGVSAGGYLGIGGEVALGYDFDAFIKSAIQAYERAF